MRQTNRELWAALTAILVISVGYLLVLAVLGGAPAASEFFGHSLGVAGFLLMLMTETLYTLRKRSRSARWGRMAGWLDFHIFTGLVGPFLVLLHSAWKFNGLAGVTLLLTGVVVASGFVGRYIYTSVPRSADGAVLQAETLQRQIQAAQAALSGWLAQQPAGAQLAAQFNAQAKLAQPAGSGGLGFWLRGLRHWQRRLDWLWLRWQTPAQQRPALAQFEALLWQQEDLRSQMSALDTARRLLAVWHAVHVPIGMMLFTAAAIHIVAAFYYATLLHLWD